MIEFSRARRAAFEPQVVNSPKSQVTPRKEPAFNVRVSPPSPQIRNTGAVSQLSLLNRVDVDSTIVEKNKTQRSTLEKTPENTGQTVKSGSTTSQDVTLKLNQTITKTTTSTPIPKIPEYNQENDERKDDLDFSISDITD
jgi:hypothetical protein